MKMTIKEAMTKNFSCDVYDDVIEDIGICFDTPVTLTESGLAEFDEVLDYVLDVDEDNCLAILEIDQYADWKARLQKAKHFFYSLAGYCTCDEWDEWFIME